MKILFVTNYFLYPSSNGGANMSRWLSAAIADQGHGVSVVCLDHGPRGPRIESTDTEQDGLPVRQLRPRERRPGETRPLWRIRPDSDMRAEADELITREKPDLVYLNGGMELGEFARAAREQRRPVLFHVHCFGHLCPRQFLFTPRLAPCSGPDTVAKCFRCLQQESSGGRRALQQLCRSHLGRMLLGLKLPEERLRSFGLEGALKESRLYLQDVRNAVDSWIVTSDRIADVHEAYGVPPDRLHRLPHFIPDDRLVVASRTRSAGPRVRVGLFGRLSPEKGTELFCNALGLLAPSIRASIDLVVITRDNPDQFLRQLITQGHMDGGNIETIRGLTGAALNQSLADLDVCVVPSVCHEIGPLTLLECVAQQTPCIVSDTVGLKEMILHGENGKIFRAGRARDLSDKLRDVLRSPGVLEVWRTKQSPVPCRADYVAGLKAILEDSRLQIRGEAPA